MKQLNRPGSSALTPWIFLVFLFLLPAMPVQAQVTCSAIVAPVSFGSVDLLAGTGLTTTANLTYTCQNTLNSNQTATVCFSIGDPHGAYYSNRWIDKGAERLYFQMYQDSAYAQIWGTVYGGAVTPPKITVFIPRRSTTSPATLTVHSRIGTGQTVSSGAYATSYGAGDTRITLSTGSNTTCQGTDSGSFSFNVSATVMNSCTVTAGSASNIQIGAASGVAADSGSNSGSSNISVTCANGTSYKIGLSPSNSSMTGAGVMSGVGANTDKVPYQLRSVSTSGPVWGNTATASAVGNGVAGTGTGVAQSVPVFAVAPSANFTPDNYTDTVTVIVNY